MSIIVNAYADRTVFLSLANVPATGLMPADIVVKFKKAGETVLSTKTLSPTTLIPLTEPGYYTIRFLPSELDVTGSFFYTLSGTLFDNFVYDEFSIEPPANSSFTSSMAVNTQIQGATVDRTILLTLGGIPAAGIAHTAVTVKYKKQGSNSLYTKVLNPLNWIGLSTPGYYTLKFSPDEMDTVGYFFFTMSSVEFDNFLYDEFTIEPPVALPYGTPAGTCVLFGKIQSIGGIPVIEQKIVVRPVEFPAKAGQFILSANTIKTTADVYGNFSIPLVRNSIVVIEIERTGIKHQITIPNQPQADLLSLLPPFAVDYT